MDIPSVLFSFLGAALKRRPRATETEIKEVMLAQRKTCLASHGSGRMMAEKMLIGKRMFNFEFTVMRESDDKE